MEAPYLGAKLKALREGRIPEDDLYGVLHEFGEADFMEAEPDVVQFLKHPNASLRYIAVNVLTLHWMLPKYRDILEGLLFEDEDAGVRRIVATGLGAFLEGARDPRAIQLLARKLRDTSEDRFVREAAFEALLAIAVPTMSESHARAKASMERLQGLVRKTERGIDEALARGETSKEFYARLDQDWETWVDWELVRAIERGEVR